MKLVTYEIGGGESHLGAVHGDGGAGSWIVDLAAAGAASPGGSAGVPALASAMALLEAGDEGLAAARAALRFAEERGLESAPWAHAFGSVRLRAPIPRPGKVLALAGNYEAHRSEGGVKSPLSDKALPEVFCKPGTSVVGTEEPILLPGPPGRRRRLRRRARRRHRAPLPPRLRRDALSYVGGYLCVNDVSGRKLDPGFERDPDILDRAKFFDWLIGKWCDSFCPIGPWLTTADEVPDPMALHLETYVNGERRQETSTGEMIHSITRTIAWCSTLMTLEPGDVIATGTPAGVGSASGRLLQPGDVVEVRIGGLGVLRNTVSAG